MENHPTWSHHLQGIFQMAPGTEGIDIHEVELPMNRWASEVEKQVENP